MCERSEPAGPLRWAREFAITAAIVIGGMLMLIGAAGTTLDQGNPDAVAAWWPFYLGGIAALLLGWINDDFSH